MYYFQCLLGVLTALAHFTIGTEAESLSVCETAYPVTIAAAGTVTYASTLTYCTDTPITVLPTTPFGASATALESNQSAWSSGSESPGQGSSGNSGGSSGGDTGPVQATSAGTSVGATETPNYGYSGSGTGEGSGSNSPGSSTSNGSSSATSGPDQIFTAGAYALSISDSASGILLVFPAMVYLLGLL
jgi:hypothetical protein